jgi:hypothetical protein
MIGKIPPNTERGSGQKLRQDAGQAHSHALGANSRVDPGIRLNPRARIG